jgi:hypothetical protein
MKDLNSVLLSGVIVAGPTRKGGFDWVTIASNGATWRLASPVALVASVGETAEVHGALVDYDGAPVIVIDSLRVSA